jgi:putative heme-binding domain-containing protein
MTPIVFGRNTAPAIDGLMKSRVLPMADWTPHSFRPISPPLEGGARGGVLRRPSAPGRNTIGPTRKQTANRGAKPLFSSPIPIPSFSRGRLESCRPLAFIRSGHAPAVLALLFAVLVEMPAQAAIAQSASDSPMVKLLKSKRVPEDRQGTIVDLIGKRGTAQDLNFIYQQALSQDGFSASVRVKALEALAGAAANRNLKPPQGLEKLTPLVRVAGSRTGASIASPAIRLAGIWKLEPAVEALAEVARSATVDEALRALALDALATIGGKAGLAPIEAIAGGNSPEAQRLQAIAALAKLDPKGAAARAAEVLAKPGEAGRNLVPLFGAFLNRQGGSEILAKALEERAISADSAKLGLRASYALGRSDQALVAVLSRAAGISELGKELSPTELTALVAEVAAKGDPARGEQVFRRTDLTCMSCHAISKAGGDVGPDLSAVGQISPPDYIINSILNPDMAIKEQYHTLMVMTVEGQIFQGIVTDKDEQRVVLKDATGASRVVPAASIEDQKPGGSLMPKGLANLMTRAEFVDLVRFLSELGKPGPYAIRAVPAIQRWKALKGVGEGLSTAVPVGSVFRDQVLRVEPERWDVAYAKVNGSLPLDEAVSKSGAKVAYLQGEIDVSAAGLVTVRTDSAVGTHLWIDDRPFPAGSSAMTVPLGAGRHSITVRIDTKARPSMTITVEIVKPPGSHAEFAIVGGR